jgi:hypothetical protein
MDLRLPDRKSRGRSKARQGKAGAWMMIRVWDITRSSPLVNNNDTPPNFQKYRGWVGRFSNISNYYRLPHTILLPNIHHSITADDGGLLAACFPVRGVTVSM